MKVFALVVNLIVNVFAINFALIPDEDLMSNSVQMLETSPSLIVNSNQGIFTLGNTYLGSEFANKNIKIDQMIKKTLHSPIATIRKSWIKGTRKGHVSLFILFSDGKCEQLEWFPVNVSTDIGEDPAGEVHLHFDVDDSNCQNADSFLGIPDSLDNVPVWLANSANKLGSKKSVDLVRWNKDDHQEAGQQLIRRHVYNALLKEANRFKDEEKYSCSSFVNNVWADVTGHKSVNDDIMLLIIKSAEKLRMKTGPIIGKMLKNFKKLRPNQTSFIN